MAGHLYYWVANWNLSRARAAQRLGGPVADMIDCTHASLPGVLNSGTSVGRFAGYVTGTPDIRWTPGDFAGVKGRHVLSDALMIDQSNQDLPLLSHVKMVVKDEEAGASTEAQAVTVAHQRLAAGDDYTIYLSESGLQSLEDAVARAGLPHGQIVAYQWASPSSNPHTPLPGSVKTLSEVNADMSVVLTSWFPLGAPVPPPHPAQGEIDAALLYFHHNPPGGPPGGQWMIKGVPVGSTIHT